MNVKEREGEKKPRYIIWFHMMLDAYGKWALIASFAA